MATFETTTERQAPGEEPEVDRHILRRLAQFVLHHRKWVVMGWIVVLLAGGAAAGSLSKRLSVDFSMPGQPGYETAKKLTAIYGANSGFMPPTIGVVTVPAGTSVSAQEAAIDAAFTSAAAKVQGGRLVDYANTHDAGLISKDGRTTIALLFTPLPKTFGVDGVTNPMGNELKAKLSGYKVGVTGLNQLSTGGDSKGARAYSPRRCSAPWARSPCSRSSSPRCSRSCRCSIAAVSILSTFLVVLGLTYITDVSLHRAVPRRTGRPGYRDRLRLLLVTRWREERDRGATTRRPSSRLSKRPATPLRLGRHRRDQPGRAHRDSGARPAQRRHRRHPHPARVDAVVLTLLPRSSAASGRASTGPASGMRAAPVRPGGLGAARSCAAAGSPSVSRLVVLGVLHRADLQHEGRAKPRCRPWQRLVLHGSRTTT